MGSRLVGLYWESTLTLAVFTISGNWLTLRGPSLRGQQGPRCQTARIQKMNDLVSTTWYLWLQFLPKPLLNNLAASQKSRFSDLRGF